jgi:hypothetical protein
MKIKGHNKIKVWAYENAYTLIFLSFMFILTWAIFAISIYFGFCRQ